MGLRHRSIRLRVGILIIVPVLCLIGLYGFAVSLTLGNALNQVQAKSLTNSIVIPLSNFQQALNKERATPSSCWPTPARPSWPTS